MEFMKRQRARWTWNYSLVPMNRPQRNKPLYNPDNLPASWESFYCAVNAVQLCTTPWILLYGKFNHSTVHRVKNGEWLSSSQGHVYWPTLKRDVRLMQGCTQSWHLWACSHPTEAGSTRFSLQKPLMERQQPALGGRSTPNHTISTSSNWQL